MVICDYCKYTIWYPKSDTVKYLFVFDKDTIDNVCVSCWLELREDFAHSKMECVSVTLKPSSLQELPF